MGWPAVKSCANVIGKIRDWHHAPGKGIGSRRKCQFLTLFVYRCTQSSDMGLAIRRSECADTTLSMASHGAMSQRTTIFAHDLKQGCDAYASTHTHTCQRTPSSEEDETVTLPHEISHGHQAGRQREVTVLNKEASARPIIETTRSSAPRMKCNEFGAHSQSMRPIHSNDTAATASTAGTATTATTATS